MSAQADNPSDHRSLREQRLDRMLEQQAFSFDHIQETVARLSEITADLAKDIEQPNPYDEDLASPTPPTEWAMAAAGAKAMAKPAFSFGTVAQAAAKRDDAIAAGQEVPSDSVLVAHNQEEAAAQLGKSAKRVQRRHVMNDKLELLEAHASEFTTELIDVTGWLEKRRVDEKDAIDLYREQVLLRAEKAERAAGGRRRSSAVSRRKSSVSGVVEVTDGAADSDWTIAEEVSARTEANDVLEALDMLEMETEETLTRFYKSLQGLSKTQRTAVVKELRGVEASLPVGDGKEQDPQVVAELRRTVAQLRLQLDQAGEGGEDEDEEDPSMEVLRLLQLSSDNQTRIRELNGTAGKKEGRLRLLRGQLTEMDQLYEEASKRESFLTDELTTLQRARQEAQVRADARLEALRRQLEEEEEARIQAAVQSVRDELRKEAERAALEAGKDAKAQEASLTERNAELRKRADELRAELEALQANGAEGLPDEIASILSQAATVGKAKSKLVALHKGKARPPAMTATVKFEETPSTAQLSELASELDALSTILQGMRPNVPKEPAEDADDQDLDTQLAMHELIVQLRSEYANSDAGGVDSFRAAQAAAEAWQQMSEMSLNAVAAAVMSTESLKESASALEEILRQVLDGDESMTLWNVGLSDTAVLSDDEVSSFEQRIQDVEADVERLQGEEEAADAKSKEQVAIEEAAKVRAATAMEMEAAAKERLGVAEAAAAAAKARLQAIEQGLSAAEVEAAERAAAEAAAAAAEARKRAEEEARAREAAKREAERLAKAAAEAAEKAAAESAAAAAAAAATAAANAQQDAEAAERAAAEERARSDAEARAAAEKAEREKSREADLESLEEAYAAASGHLSDLSAALLEVQNAMGGKKLRLFGRAAAVSISRVFPKPHAPPQPKVEDPGMSEAERALAAQTAHRNQLAEMERALRAEIEGLRMEAELHEESMEKLRAELLAVEAAFDQALEKQGKLEHDAEAQDKARVDAEASEADAEERRKEREVAAAAAAAEAAAEIEASLLLMSVPAQAPAVAEQLDDSQEEEHEPDDEMELSKVPKDGKALLSLLDEQVARERRPWSNKFVDHCAHLVEGMEASLRDALRQGQELAQEANVQKAQKSAARMSLDFGQKELERLKARVEEQAMLRAKALAKYGEMTHLFVGADQQQTSQICRVLLERDRLTAKIKEVSKTITAFRTLWSMSQASKPSKVKDAAKAREARENAEKNAAMADADGASGMSSAIGAMAGLGGDATQGSLSDTLSAATQSTQFWKNCDKMAESMSSATNLPPEAAKKMDKVKASLAATAALKTHSQRPASNSASPLGH